jgi:hypothetical protein
MISIGLLFWLLMIIWLIFGIWTEWPIASNTYHPIGRHILLWILLFLLGWQVFGWPISGK